MTPAERLFLCTYVLLAPLAWAGMLLALGFGWNRMMKLRRSRVMLPQPAPRVTVIVPAKDEGGGIRECIERIFAQDYPDFDVIAIDDRSTDDTGALLDQIAASNPRLRVIHIPGEALPEGWLGKCNALWTCTRGLSSEWVLFVDSDVKLQPNALSRALALADQRHYDALSITTRIECHTFWERLILPLAACAWTVMHTVSLTNEDNRPTIAAANGQFLLVRRKAYEAVGGHQTVRDQITEDVELMRSLKGRGFRVRFMIGSDLATTRMHTTLPQMFSGWARIYSGTSRRKPGRILGAMLFLIICGMSVYPALAWGLLLSARGAGHAWLIASAAHLAVMTAYLVLIYRLSGNHSRYAMLFPLAATIMLAIFAGALRACRTGRIRWRGTDFAAPIPVHRR